MSSAARSALILGDPLREYEVCDAAFFREFLARQKKSLDVPWMLAMAGDQAYDFVTGTEIAPRWRRRLTARPSRPVFNAINAASREDAYVGAVPRRRTPRPGSGSSTRRPAVPIGTAWPRRPCPTSPPSSG